jgi:uncharacterized RDD family membrane protein YckC
VVGFVIVSIAWDLFFSQTVALSVPPHWLNELMVWVILVLYLTAGWGFGGRTLGKQMMGLRIVRSNGTRLRAGRAFWRALLCATFFPVLLLALVNRRNRGLEDVVFGTVVAYDWLPESTDPPIAVLQLDAQLVAGPGAAAADSGGEQPGKPGAPTQKIPSQPSWLAP